MLKYNWDDVVKAFHAGLTVEAIGKEYPKKKIEDPRQHARLHQEVEGQDQAHSWQVLLEECKGDGRAQEDNQEDRQGLWVCVKC